MLGLWTVLLATRQVPEISVAVAIAFHDEPARMRFTPVVTLLLAAALFLVDALTGVQVSWGRDADTALGLVAERELLKPV